MQHISIIQDSFGQHYRVCTADDGPTRTPLTPEHFRDVVLTEQFVQRLKVPAGYWQRILSRCNAIGINANISAEERISQLLIQGVIKLYRVKHLEKRTGTTIGTTSAPTSFPAIRTAKGQDYQLMPASVLLERPRLHLKTFRDRKEATDFLSEMDPAESPLDVLIEDIGLPLTQKGRPDRVSEPDRLAQALLDRSVVVVDLPRSGAATRTTGSVTAVNAEGASRQPYSLGPHDDGTQGQSRKQSAQQSKNDPEFTDLAEMDPDFSGEETGVVWGSKVVYLDEEERQEYQLQIKDGKLIDSDGNLFDSANAESMFNGGEGSAIFVMDEYGSIYASKIHERGKFHHSSLLAGEPVASAGEILVENGVIMKITRGR